jgi:hypothetical protein
MAFQASKKQSWWLEAAPFRDSLRDNQSKLTDCEVASASCMLARIYSARILASLQYPVN